MKKFMLTAAFLATTFSAAHAGIHFDIGIGFPGGPARVIPAPRVVYLPPPPVYVLAPPACPPQPLVVVYGPPVALAPPPPVLVAPPGFYFGFGSGWHYRPHRGWRGCG